MHSITRRNLLETLGLFCTSLILFTWSLSGDEIIGFESRFYLFAQEMWRDGVSWFPTTYQQPYPDYPATSTLLIYLASLGFGGLNKFTAVLPSAIAASLTLTLTYHIGALTNKRWGWCAVLFMILTMAFFKNARSLSLDMYTTLFTTACFYLVYSADVKNKPSLSYWIYPLLVFAFAFRGPIGLVMPTGVICSYYLFGGQFKQCIVKGLCALALLILCTIALLGLAYHVGGQVFLQDVLRMEVLGRIDNHSLPRYFYFVDSMANYALSFPLAWLVVLGAAYYLIKTRPLTTDIKLIVSLFGWMMVILLGMSIPGDKKVRYILPMVPAIALLAAYPFVAPIKEKYFVYLRRILLGFFSLLPLIFLLAITFILSYTTKQAIVVDIHYWSVIVFLFVMQALGFLVLYRYANRVHVLSSYILLIAAFSFAVVHISVIEPIEIHIDRARDLVRHIEAERLHHHASLIFYKERPDSMPIKYLINMPKLDQPQFLDNEESLVQVKQPAYFVTSAAYFAELKEETVAKFRIVAKDTLGHVKVVIFTQR